METGTSSSGRVSWVHWGGSAGRGLVAVGVVGALAAGVVVACAFNGAPVLAVGCETRIAGLAGAAAVGFSGAEAGFGGAAAGFGVLGAGALIEAGAL